MSDIFREVDEEVRREQYSALWKRYGPFLIGIAILVIVFVAGWRGWEWYEARRSAELGGNYFAALELASAGQHEQASQAMAELAGTGEPYGTLAALRRAAELAQAGNLYDAVAAYDAVAENAAVSPLLRGLARVRAGYLLVDTAEPAELRSRMEGYLADQASPWRNAAREILGLAAYRAGDYEQASQLFEEILADPQAPQDLLQRAQMMFTLLAAGAPGAITAAEPAEEPVAAGTEGGATAPAAPAAPAEGTTGNTQ